MKENSEQIMCQGIVPKYNESNTQQTHTKQTTARFPSKLRSLANYMISFVENFPNSTLFKLILKTQQNFHMQNEHIQVSGTP